SNKIVLYDENGNSIADYSFTSDVIDVYAESDEYIMVLLSNNELISLKYDDSLVVDSDQQFSCQITDIAYYISYVPDKGVTFFVVSDNGELFSYGKNAGIIDPDLDKDSLIEEPQIVETDIRLVYSHYAVDGDNCVIDLSNGNKSETVPCNILGISCFTYAVVYTDNAYYEIANNEMTLEEKGNIQDGTFLCTETGFVYKMNDLMYYTGFLGGLTSGKGLLETNDSEIDLPKDCSYCVIQYGVICYDSNSLNCYSV
ncbi:MAG: hypothetical protein J5883_03845, partial [Clostridiales bacterium]|nr:hypothetical protein [Clostridiales bacterium]